MTTKLLLPAAAVAMLLFAVVHVLRSSQDAPLAEPPYPPPEAAQVSVLSATGTVEPQSELVAVAAAVPGVVAEVLVRAGQQVKARDPLFRIDDSTARAALAVRAAQRETAAARLGRLTAPPREDEVLTSAARVRAARAALAASRAAHEQTLKQHAESLIGSLAVEQREQAVTAAQAHLEQAEAEDRLLRAGPSPTEVAVARAQLAEADALLAQARADLQQLTTRAPMAGTILRLGVRAGEAVPGLGEPPVVLGDVQALHLRVDLDEALLGRFRTGAAAHAQVPGQGKVLPLEFVRAEPMLGPGRRLSGAPGERTDGRALQVIYRLGAGAESVHVGQRLDVFIDAP
jgi:multidrug resistance efflux pump